MQKYEEYKILEIQFEEMKRDNHEKNKEVREAEELFYTLYTGVSAQKWIYGATTRYNNISTFTYFNDYNVKIL